MAEIFPAANGPSDISLSISGTTLTVGWKGDAPLFKIRWREDDTDDVWQEQQMAGGGASGGSPYFTGDGDTPSNPGSFTVPVDASFNITGVIGKMYSLRLVNVFTDGSEYYTKKTVLFESDCPAIENLRFIKREDAEVIVAWTDTETGDPYYVMPVELDKFGNERDGEGVETLEATASFPFLGGQRYAIYVNQKCGEIEVRTSKPLYLSVCGCGAPIINVNVTGGGGGDTGTDNYEHDQPSAASVWNIPHMLDYYPTVKAVDLTGKEMEGVVQYQDQNNLSVTFAKALAGKAYVS